MTRPCIQRNCGSCWAHAAVAVAESYHAISKGVKPVQYSEQELVDCEENSIGCNGGYPDNALEWVL